MTTLRSPAAPCSPATASPIPVASCCSLMGVLPSGARPQKIDIGEDADPDDVEGVPEQCEAHTAPHDVGPEALRPELRHHGTEPEQARCDMESVEADQGEKGRKERAA